MTRQKKSRKANDNGQRHLPASEIRKIREHKDESKKKGAGLKSGNRNSMQQAKTSQDSAGSKQKKDPRLGSKKPIALLPETSPELLPASTAPAPLPKVQLKAAKAEPLSPEQELLQLENDPKLQLLLERVERDELLTGKDAKYFNRQTARISELLALLGLDDAQPDATTSEQDEDPLSRFERTDWRKDLLGDEDPA